MINGASKRRFKRAGARPRRRELLEPGKTGELRCLCLLTERGKAGAAYSGEKRDGLRGLCLLTERGKAWPKIGQGTDCPGKGRKRNLPRFEACCRTGASEQWHWKPVDDCLGKGLPPGRPIRTFYRLQKRQKPESISKTWISRMQGDAGE